jgi:hypothetical protein
LQSCGFRLLRWLRLRCCSERRFKLAYMWKKCLWTRLERGSIRAFPSLLRASHSSELCSGPLPLSFAKSPTPKSPSLQTLLSSLAEAEEQLETLSTVAHPAAVSSLLDKPLALPVLDADSDVVFTEEDIREWEKGSTYFRSTFEDLAAEAAQQWVDTLTWDPAERNSPTFLADPNFLSLVQEELNLVQAGRPTKAVYAVEEYAEDDWARDEAEKRRKEEEEEAKAEAQFELFLDGMFEKAEEMKEKKDNKEAEPKQADEENVLPPNPFASEAKRARALLELPQDTSRPISATNPTWRNTLRKQWEMMYDPRQGGVLGEAFESFNRMFDDLGDDNAEEEGEAVKKEWQPKSIPLMANSLLRAHLQQAIALSSGRVGGYEGVWGVDKQGEESILPAILQSVPPAFLTLPQVAVWTDQCARRWATSLLSLVFTSPTSSSPSSSATATDARTTASLLRSSPLPSFLRTLEALFALPMNEKAMRIGVSKHEMAFVVFANSAQMEANGKKDVVGAVAVEWARRRVDMERKAAVEAEEREQGTRSKEEL